MTDTLLTSAEIDDALRIAGELIDAGIPVFAAHPCPPGCAVPGHGERTEFHLPLKWQLTYPSRVWLDRWEPGMALAAVGGHTADFLDEDTHHGGDRSMLELISSGHMPRTFGHALTPSGGKHYLISPLGEHESNMVLPGIDYQGGAPDGQGRAFVWIAPTVKRSKNPATLGELRPYRWVTPPDLEALAEFAGSDDSGHGFVARLAARRAARSLHGGARLPDQSAVDHARSQDQLFDSFSAASMRGDERSFTLSQAQDFVRPALLTLREAKIGEIEERANQAAVMLAHFVPAFWDADTAYALLIDALSYTAYDPQGPSSWTADKFKPVLDGRRAPLDGWKATVRPEVSGGGSGSSPFSSEPAAPPTEDAVAALLAEMLTAEQIRDRPTPKHLVRGLLTLDSCAWIIGAPGSKKSFVALDIACSVARGVQWQGLDVRSGTVVMIVAEGAGGVSLRVKAYEKRYGPIGGRLLILPRPVQSGDAAAWAVLVEACRRLEPALVVADTQARITAGLDENHSRDMGVYIDAVNAIRQATGACVLTVHHTGRNGGDARGSSAIDGAQDTELKINADGLRGTLSVEKQKDLVEREDMPLAFELIDLGEDEDGNTLSSLVLGMAPDAFDAASGVVNSTEDWAVFYGKVQVQIIQVLIDQGRQSGLTQAEAKRVVADRWYSGETGRTRGLRSSTWATAWNTAKEKATSEGDRIMVNVSGERWAIDEVAFANLNAEMNKDLPAPE